MLIYVCNICGRKIEDANINKWAHKKLHFSSDGAISKIIIELDSTDTDYCSNCYSKKP